MAVTAQQMAALSMYESGRDDERDLIVFLIRQEAEKGIGLDKYHPQDALAKLASQLEARERVRL